MLNNNAVFLLRFDCDAAFEHIVAHWFLDVNMLASLSGPDSHKRMPVIWASDRNGVQRFVLERLSNIA